MARGESLGVERVRPDRRGPAGRARPRRGRVTRRHGERAGQDQPEPRGGPGPRRRVPPARDRLPGGRPVRRGHRARTPTRSSVTVTADARLDVDDVPADATNIAVRAALLLAGHHGLRARGRDRHRQGHPGRRRDGRRQRRRCRRAARLRPRSGGCGPRAEELLELAARARQRRAVRARRRHRARQRPRRDGHPGDDPRRVLVGRPGVPPAGCPRRRSTASSTACTRPAPVAREPECPTS